METQTLWLLVMSAATPIAGVVGFATQLRQVRKARLENEKLLLEIDALKNAATSRESRIIQVSTEEVLRYTRTYDDDMPMFCRTSDSPPQPVSLRKKANQLLRDTVLLTSVLIVIGYFLFDVYRISKWLISLL